MGMAPEGIVFFGYSFEEGELENGMPDLDDIAATRATAKGAKRVDYSSCPRNYGADRDAWYEVHRDELRAWYDALKAENDLWGDVGWHIAGSYDYGSPYVCIKSSRMSAEWGEMIELHPSSMAVVHSNWEETLLNHLADVNVPIPTEEPRWYLTSLYG